MSFRLSAVLLLVLCLGCEGWQSVLVESEDFEPQLNVLAILSPDEGGTVEILVMRTLPLEGSSVEYGDPDTVCYYDEYYDTTFCYLERPWISRIKVTDAEVTLSDGAVTYPFVYDSTQYASNGFDVWSVNHAGRYSPVDIAFVPQAGVTYELKVETPGGLQVSGSCTIPPPVEIKVDQLSDTLQSGELFNVVWNPVTDYVRVKIESVEESLYWMQSCYVWEEAIVRHDSSWTFQIVPECWEWSDTLSPYEEVEIAVTAMDERYYNYFYGSDIADYEEMSFFFLGEGDTGRSQGIEGGLGVFASFRTSSVRRVIRL
ncbi:MAG: DUF4249 family protein [Fidelibacterota bacterium]|nr:MAG: DUF4249 family protein [Candidatus Neomarinimicrobiota bacterium]